MNFTITVKIFNAVMCHELHIYGVLSFSMMQCCLMTWPEHQSRYTTAWFCRCYFAFKNVTPFLAFSKWYISISAGNRPQPQGTCLHEKIQASDRASVRCLALCEECYQTLAQGNKEEGHARAACMDSVHCKSPLVVCCKLQRWCSFVNGEVAVNSTPYCQHPQMDWLVLPENG